MIGKDWTNNFMQQNKSETDLQTLIYKVRTNLTFNPTPSINLINQGEVDCAGACFLTKIILRHFFPKMKLSYASIPSQPWNSRKFNDSKHLVLIEFLKDKLRFIDPTPINGYGYGKITSFIKKNLWANQDSYNVLQISNIESDNFWTNIVYDKFKVVSDNTIEIIINLNNSKHNLNNNVQPIKIPNKPPNINGWKKDYYRLKASEIRKYHPNETKELQYLLKALKCSNQNPYLLQELLVNLKETTNQSLKKEIQSQYIKVKSSLINANKKIIKIWKEQLKLYFKQKEWGKYIYLLGCIYWRVNSNDFLLNKKNSEYPHLFINEEKIYYHRVSSLWFSKNDFKIFISKKIIKSKNCSFQKEFRISKDKINLYNYLFPHKKIETFNFIGIGTDTKNKTLTIIDDPEECYTYFIGILKLEMLIQSV